jgi:hypothetical protein
MRPPRPAPAVRTARTLERRTLLRGAGVALALPWLAAFERPARAALGCPSPGPAPRRLVYVYVPNGVQREHWKPAPGPLAELPLTLLPLEPWRARIAVLSGLTQDKARANGDGPGDHARAAAAFLTGVQPFKAEGQVRLARSADQYLADVAGRSTPFRAVHVGGEGAQLSGQCDSGYACAYQSHLSWRSPTTPDHKESDPRRLFDRLFRAGDGGRSPAWHRRRRSLLDYVGEEATRLGGQLGGDDRARLDDYLTGVRELEQRLQRAAALEAAVGDELRPTAAPNGFGERVEQLYELLVLALRQDATRVATMLVANEGSNRAYPEAGSPEGHHGLSHHQGDPEKRAVLQRIEQGHLTLWAGFLARLAASPEGERDLLASTAVVYGSGIGDGDAHDHHDLPILLAGEGVAHPWLGQHREFAPETPLNDLHLTLLAGCGVFPESLGDGRGPLPS